MLDIPYDITASECPNCKKNVMVPMAEKAPHCYFCGRRVEPGDPNRYSNINATMQRIASLIRESKVFDASNTNTALARAIWESLGKFVVDALILNEASIRFGYYGKPHEYDNKMLDRTSTFLQELQNGVESARKELAFDPAGATPGKAR